MAKTKFAPRNLMELAIEVMRQSVHEPRADGKASPLVGAVLYKQVNANRSGKAWPAVAKVHMGGPLPGAHAIPDPGGSRKNP